MEMEKLFKLNKKENVVDIEAKYEKILLEPYQHINEDKGKDFRNALIKLYNHWLKLDEVDVQLVLEFAQWIHTAFLAMDDIQDSAELRRGNPVIHVIYGAGRTITGIDMATFNLLINRIWNKPHEFHMSELHSVLTVLQGQAMEMYWRDNFICPSEDDYLEMLYRKTGYYVYGLITYMQLYSKIKLDLKKLSILFGIYLQMSDDYRGFKSRFPRESKGFCDDIREGKFILPVIHAIKSRPNDNRVLDILKMRTNDYDVKMECLQLLEEFGSFDYTMKKITYFKSWIVSLVEELGTSESFKLVLDLHNHDC